MEKSKKASVLYEGKDAGPKFTVLAQDPKLLRQFLVDDNGDRAPLSHITKKEIVGTLRSISDDTPKPVRDALYAQDPRNPIDPIERVRLCTEKLEEQKRRELERFRLRMLVLDSMEKLLLDSVQSGSSDQTTALAKKIFSSSSYLGHLQGKTLGDYAEEMRVVFDEDLALDIQRKKDEIIDKMIQPAIDQISAIEKDESLREPAASVDLATVQTALVDLEEYTRAVNPTDLNGRSRLEAILLDVKQQTKIASEKIEQIKGTRRSLAEQFEKQRNRALEKLRDVTGRIQAAQKQFPGISVRTSALLQQISDTRSLIQSLVDTEKGRADLRAMVVVVDADIAPGVLAIEGAADNAKRLTTELDQKVPANAKTFGTAEQDQTLRADGYAAERKDAVDEIAKQAASANPNFTAVERKIAALKKAYIDVIPAYDAFIARLSTSTRLDEALENESKNYEQDERVIELLARLRRSNTAVLSKETQLSRANALLEKWQQQEVQYSRNLPSLSNFITELRGFIDRVSKIDTSSSDAETKLRALDNELTSTFETSRSATLSTEVEAFKTLLATVNTRKTALLARIDAEKTRLQKLGVKADDVSAAIDQLKYNLENLGAVSTKTMSTLNATEQQINSEITKPLNVLESSKKAEVKAETPEEEPVPPLKRNSTSIFSKAAGVIAAIVPPLPAGPYRASSKPAAMETRQETPVVIKPDPSSSPLPSPRPAVSSASGPVNIKPEPNPARSASSTPLKERPGAAPSPAPLSEQEIRIRKSETDIQRALQDINRRIPSYEESTANSDSIRDSYNAIGKEPFDDTDQDYEESVPLMRVLLVINQYKKEQPESYDRSLRPLVKEMVDLLKTRLQKTIVDRGDAAARLQETQVESQKSALKTEMRKRLLQISADLNALRYIDKGIDSSNNPKWITPEERKNYESLSDTYTFRKETEREPHLTRQELADKDAASASAGILYYTEIETYQALNAVLKLHKEDLTRKFNFFVTEPKNNNTFNGLLQDNTDKSITKFSTEDKEKLKRAGVASTAAVQAACDLGIGFSTVDESGSSVGKANIADSLKFPNPSAKNKQLVLAFWTMDPKQTPDAKNRPAKKMFAGIATWKPFELDELRSTTLNNPTLVAFSEPWQLRVDPQLSSTVTTTPPPSAFIEKYTAPNNWEVAELVYLASASRQDLTRDEKTKLVNGETAGAQLLRSAIEVLRDKKHTRKLVLEVKKFTKVVLDPAPEDAAQTRASRLALYRSAYYESASKNLSDVFDDKVLKSLPDIHLGNEDRLVLPTVHRLVPFYTRHGWKPCKITITKGKASFKKTKEQLGLTGAFDRNVTDIPGFVITKYNSDKSKVAGSAIAIPSGTVWMFKDISTNASTDLGPVMIGASISADDHEGGESEPEPVKIEETDEFDFADITKGDSTTSSTAAIVQSPMITAKEKATTEKKQQPQEDYDYGNWV